MQNLSTLIQFHLLPKSQFPKNLEFYSISNDETYKNPGIFFLYYRGELIYIGFSNNYENIIAERVVRQLATITLRDHRIQFSQSAANVIGSDDVFTSYFVCPKLVIANIDFQTSKNRVEYAFQHWDEFKNFDATTLSRFELKWYPNPDLNGCASIEGRCQQLKNHFKPRCNKEYQSPSLVNV